MPWSTLQIPKEDLCNAPADSAGARRLSFVDAMREALSQAMKHDPKVFVMGQGADDPQGIFGTTLNLHKEFGSQRCFDTPLSENALTGIAMGAAMTGMRPVHIHNRPDFLMLAMDQIVNHAAKWFYMFDGKVNIPVVIKATVGRGWGSGPQHSQSLYGMFMHIPGLRVVVPSTPYDAKGLLLASIADGNPVIFIDHRWLFKQSGNVPQEMYKIPLGKGIVRREGKDLTIVAISYMTVEAMKAADLLAKEGIWAEVIDPRTLCPLDTELMVTSVKKTGRLIIADADWRRAGAADSIASVVAEKGFGHLKAPIRHVTFPDVHTPSGYTLEDSFYPKAQDIVACAKEVMR